MSDKSRDYQGRITGFPYSNAEKWSIEWEWLTVEFDGFIADECLLQEAKGDYDQFLDGSIPGATHWFSGFRTMPVQARRQASVVNANPPTRLTYYFMTPLAFRKMRRELSLLNIQSVYQP